ncbi:hypothetical protein PspLS_04709 [Pyricularia sp. CBS 133598]|nr:hypothetical protein PspLS_04709 [Pyricularia sp. CBS 133598]
MCMNVMNQPCRARLEETMGMKQACHDGGFSGPYRAFDSPVGLSITPMHSCLAGVRKCALLGRVLVFGMYSISTSGNPAKYLQYIAGGEDTAGNRLPSATAQKKFLPEKASNGIIILVNIPLKGVASRLASPMPRMPFSRQTNRNRGATKLCCISKDPMSHQRRTDPVEARSRYQDAKQTMKPSHPGEKQAKPR